MQQVGGALGIALLGTIFSSRVEGPGAPDLAGFESATRAALRVAVALVAAGWALTFLQPSLPSRHS